MRVAHKRTPHRHTLALPTGKLTGFTIQKMFDLKGFDRLCHLGVAFGLWHAAHFKAKGDVLPDIHVGIKRVALKHHRDVAFGRRQIINHIAINADFTGCQLFKPGNRVQKC